ncbi:uncharacterized protein [Ptychodera flava]|uniref:uncharacterized protein n=1 Tax=Ptychodera flava TaxID=63121 RepID=UPI00396AA65F
MMNSVQLTVENKLTGEHMGAYKTIIRRGTNVYDTMLKIEEENPDKFCFKAIYFEGLGHYITTINGLEESHANSNYWMYYVNGVLAPVGVDTYKPDDGDTITWKYEHFSGDSSVKLQAIHTISSIKAATK